MYCKYKHKGSVGTDHYENKRLAEKITKLENEIEENNVKLTKVEAEKQQYKTKLQS